MKPRVSLLITDLDNTLWDWVAQWYAAFDAMVEEVANVSGLARERIEADMQKVFQTHRTSEYALVIEETECLLRLDLGADLTLTYATAIEAKRAARLEALRLYPGVMGTLMQLRERGTTLVAYTESMEFYSMIRMKKLGLDGVIDELWSPADHPLPDGYERRHAFEKTVQRFTPAGELKPNPKVLLDIIEARGGTPATTAYVGDNLLKDIAMAQSAGVAGVYASYGAAQDTAGYACLKRVTHWTPGEVAREQEVIDTDEVVPEYTLGNFAELTDLFDFAPAESRPTSRSDSQ